jgi:hypothetical protein
MAKRNTSTRPTAPPEFSEKKARTSKRLEAIYTSTASKCAAAAPKTKAVPKKATKEPRPKATRQGLKELPMRADDFVDEGQWSI